MGKSKETKKIISQLTGGLVTTTIDLTVLIAALGGGLILFGPGAYDSGWKRKKQFEASLEVAQWAYSRWDKSKFRRALGRAVGEGLLEKVIGGHRLTHEGENRLNKIIPPYKRPENWDGKLWLITYDIPEDQGKYRRRDALRKHLEKIGCGMVQRSVWLSVKDPRKWVKDKISQLGLKSGVIISCLGKDGSLGDEDVKAMIARVFKLAGVNRWYQDWIAQIDKQKSKSGQDWYRLGLLYLSILDNDPVIPQELLPSDWAGNKARRVFQDKILPKMGYIKKYIH